MTAIGAQHSVVAVFAERGSAEAAIDHLWHEGFPKERIGLAAPGERFRQASTATEAVEEAGADGAVMGAIQGTTAGALAGALVAATIPGIGPILGGGILASIAMGTATGAAAGAALGGFAGPFVAMGLSEEDAHRYESQFRAGRTIVVVQPSEAEDPERAVMLLRSHNPIQIDTRARINEGAGQA